MRRGAGCLRLLGSAALLACPQPAPASPTGGTSAGDVDRGFAPAAGCAAPRGWGVEAATQGLDYVRNSLWLDRAGTIHWNGVPIDRTRLRQYMGLVATMNPIPAVIVAVDPAAPCAQGANLLATVAGAIDCSRLCSYRTAPFDPLALPPSPAPPAPPPRRR